MTRALITGASTGLGAEYARQLAARGDDLVLVARDETALRALADELTRRHAVDIEVLAADLLDPAQCGRVETRLRDAVDIVDMLVNNAGFGLGLGFVKNDVEDEVRHLRLHNEVPLRLVHAALPGMLDRGHGRIVNVASVAAFIPRSTYSACKRWLVELSRWLGIEYGPRGVTATAVCPGYTHTEFHARLGLPPGKEGVPGFLWLDAPDVVAASLRDVDRGRPVSIPSLRYKTIVALTRLVPDRLAARVGRMGR